MYACQPAVLMSILRCCQDFDDLNMTRMYLLSHLRNGETNCKRCAFINSAPCADIALVFFHNFFTDGEANACSFVFGPCMQALEHGKHLLGVLLFKANPIVLYINAAIFFNAKVI